MADEPTAVITTPPHCVHIRATDADCAVECGRPSPEVEAVILECELGKLQLLVESEAPIYAFCPNCLGAYLARLTARNAELEARIERVECWTGAAEPEAWERFVARVASSMTELAEAQLHGDKEGEA